jgi:hypothetical protein
MPPNDDAEVTLLDQMKWVTFGHQVDDVLLVSMALLMQCVVQRTSSKDAALDFWAALSLQAAAEIDRDYDGMRLDGALTGQKQ